MISAHAKGAGFSLKLNNPALTLPYTGTAFHAKAVKFPVILVREMNFLVRES